MSILVFPNILPNSVDFYYRSESKMSISPLNGATTIIAKPGDRWMVDLNIGPLFDEKRAEMIRFLTRLRYQTNSFMLPPHFYRRRGGFVPTNLAPSGGTFDATILPWTGSSAVLSLNAGMLKVQNSGAAVGEARSGALTVVANTPYLLNVEAVAGNASSFRILVGSTAGASNYGDSTAFTAQGYRSLGFTPTGTTIHVTMTCETSVSGNFVFYDNLGIHQAAQAVGAVAIGDTMTMDGLLPTSTAGVLRATDMFEVNGELKMLEFDMDTSSGGAAFAKFGPPLRAALLDNTYVNIANPRGRFYLADQPGKVSTRNFFESAVSLMLMEDIGL